MTDQSITLENRPMGQAVLRGFQCKCPNCGSGPLLKGYLTLREECTVCRQDLTPARADDGPAYLTILLVGHILAPLLHVFFTTFRPEPMVMASLFGVLAVGLSLFLLPRLKGVVVAIQWARYMHGFGRSG
ncbi:DUF983 domain-containing protein [Algirhabdus cladophorae]|uniref:DUF983 domain-containing protein n=1 Tax=Algirhabdus cladophorae TaxID=3377108 RepID=UPI003B84974A